MTTTKTPAPRRSAKADRPSFYDTARSRTTRAAQRASDGLNDNLAPALIGGLAVGIVAGALLPRTARETALLGPIGARVGEAARAALDAGKEAGGTSLGDFKLNADSARSHASRVAGDIGKAASEAGLAALRGDRD